jgi:protein-S-isoprenylcysteine O-methyltransferase Ste14
MLNDPQNESGERVTRGVTRFIVKSFAFTLILSAILFASSGDLGWGAAWIYIGLYTANQIVLILALPRDLLAERSTMQHGTKRWDVVLSVLGALLLPLLTYLIAGFDRRYGWTERMPLSVQGIALLLMGLAVALTSWAMLVNTFFSGTVRIQRTRGHAVVRDGPYRYVRHPGYVGGIVHHLSVSLVLGSLWGLIPGLLGALALILRTALEDETLHQELVGYETYAQQVTYRLLPGVW